MNARVVLGALIGAVLAAGIVAAAVHDGAAPGPEQARLEVHGAASVTSVDGTTRPVVDDVEVVEFGDRIVVEAGTALLELAGGATYELRHRDGVGTELEVGRAPRVTAGDVLVVDGFPAQVAVETATLSAQGPLRVDAEDTVASAYAHRARVTGVGDAVELVHPRRLVLVAGATPEPIVYDGSDEWDRRFLGEAIAFGERLEALARGYTSDAAPGVGRSVDFFRSVIPALADESALGPDLLDPARPPGETLVGAAITVQGSRGTFRERWDAVFSFRAAGAEWGLVALDQGVSSAPVLDTIELAIGVSDDDATPSAPTTTIDSRPLPTTTTSTTSTTTPDGAPPTTGTTTTTTTTTVPPSEPGLLDPIIDPIIDPVAELLGVLLDALGLGDG